MGSERTGRATHGDYVAFLLRLWREDEDKAHWRASLQNPHSGEQLGFGSVDELFAFLQRQLSLRPRTQADPVAQASEEIEGQPGL